MSLSNILLIPGIGGGYALDSLRTGLESAWSVGRRLLSTYTGPIIRVRRSSDSAEQDFYGTLAGGAVDAAAVESFCGAGNGFLTTIYGQSIHARNLTQTTAAIQPLVVSGGVAQTINGRLAAAFDGATTSRRMSVASSTAMYNFLHNGTSSTFYSVQTVVDDATNKSLFATQRVDTGFRLIFNTSEGAAYQIRGASPNIPVASNKSGAFTTNVFTGFVDADNATAANRESSWRDGAALTGLNASTDAVSTGNATENLFIGTSSTGTLQFNGLLAELVLWSQDRTSQRTVWETSAKSFWGTP